DVHRPPPLPELCVKVRHSHAVSHIGPLPSLRVLVYWRRYRRGTLLGCRGHSLPATGACGDVGIIPQGLCTIVPDTGGGWGLRWGWGLRLLVAAARQRSGDVH